jgi:hypothetical protein
VVNTLCLAGEFYAWLSPCIDLPSMSSKEDAPRASAFPAHATIRCALTIAIAINTDGWREVLGICRGPIGGGASGSSVTDAARLARRQAVVVSDAHADLEAATKMLVHR